ncbi:MAG: hypothetical protein FWB80_02360 [Defluviitaleaceae bacterium]|nr:hypothetical protein [Defluviitaleaceae bacterium]
MKIQTIRGSIDPKTLGFCHSHDHIMVAKGKPAEVDPALCMDDYDKSLEELRLFKRVGGSAIVDCQPVGAGRMSAELAKLSEQSGIHVVSATGFHKMALYYGDSWVFSFGESELEELFVHELTQGMYTNTETGSPTNYESHKAGVIKVAYDIVGLTPQYKKLFSAAAKAQIKTNAPMIIHIDNGSNPVVLDEFLTQAGVDPTKRIYCHLDRAVEELSTHIELCKRGSYVEYDTIYRQKYHTDMAELEIIQRMLDAGFNDKILLGLDSTRTRFKSYGGEPGLGYIKEGFLPLLEQGGISASVSNKFMVENPSVAFAF